MLNGYKIIGFCCAMAHKEPTRTIIKRLAEQVENHGDCRMLIFQCFEDMYFQTRSDTGGKSVFSLIDYNMIDIMVIAPISMHDSSVTEEIARNCFRHKIPVITVDAEIKGASCITFDYKKAFGEITEHILSQHGCRRVKLIAGLKGNSYSEERVQVCREIMQSHGLTLDKNDIYYCDFWDIPTYEAMERFFASGEPLPDVFICCNDTMAMAVCLKLNEHGFKVPDDVLVTGFDGIDMEKYHKPRLTTASRSDEQLAQTIFEMTDRLLSGEQCEPICKVLDYSPVFSESCGCTCFTTEDNNDKLSELVKSYSNSLSYEQHVHGMENLIASDPSFENVYKVMNEYCIPNTVLCLTDEYYRYFSGDETEEELAKFKGFGYMHEFVCTLINKKADRHGTVFPAREIVPGLGEILDSCHSVYLCPVHFQDMVQGYLLTSFVPDEHHEEHLFTFCSALNRCLENMRTHEHMAALNRRLKFMFYHDHLTQIYNRQGFYNQFRKSFSATGSKKHDVFIISIDLNDMKQINDSFGHSAGDEALCITAKSMMSASMLCGGDVICSRFGGDEFVAAKACCGNAEEQSIIYRDGLISALDKLNAESGNPFVVKVSIGVYSASLEETDSIDELIELADRLMYSDKAKYKREPRNKPLPHKNTENE